VTLATFHHREFPLSRIREAKRETVTVCLPAREVATTIGPILEVILGLRDEGIVDQVLVIDAASADGTATLAERLGAEVHQEAALMPEIGPPSGKGDAMWRGLSAARGDIVAYVDADSENFGDHYVRGLVGALVCEPGIEFVKGFYRRPFRSEDGTVSEHGGGRVTELTARPLLSMFWPELAQMRQPLAGEIAARRRLFERIPFATGYAIETTMLIDVYRRVGIAALAQVDLVVRQNRHQPLSALNRMASSVLAGVATRLRQDGRLTVLPEVELEERPPLASLRMPA
jgi:glucosyl-3-phosphoglycerate synthase